MNPFAIDHVVKISARAIRRLRLGHLWIYSGDILEEPDRAAPAIVRVSDKAENNLGYAFYSRRSQIRLRYFARPDEIPTPDMLRSRLQQSLNRRKDLCREGTACRLVFGEADLLPAIIVDRYDRYLVLQTLSYGAEAFKTFLTESLQDLLNPLGILERNDGRARKLEDLDSREGVLLGSVPDEVEIEEGGVRFLVNMRSGQKTGFFLDQSRNRIAARHYAFGRALDCFTNTGAFALHLSRSCDDVTAVDISSSSLAMANRNRDLNASENVHFDEENVFDYLRSLDHSGKIYNTVCLDPPAFAKSRKAFSAARKGYKEINLRAMKILQKEGILITSSCSYHFSEANFLEVLCEAAADAHRQIQVVERRGQPPDHPVLASMPETHYLKCFILRIL